MRGDFRRVLCLTLVSWAACAASPLRGARDAALLEAGVTTQAQELPCLNDCAGQLGKRGTCVKGICVCDEGFFGPDCSLTDKPGLPGKDGLLAQRDEPDFTSSTETPRDGATCTDPLCASVCTYGGVCKDARTCMCRLDRGNETAAQPAAGSGSDAPPGEPTPVADDEYRALMDLFDSLGAPAAPGNPCTHWREWPAVRCSIDGHIIGIDLGRRKLTGTISSAVGKLRFLRDLMLNNNGIRGSLPKELFELPFLENVLVYRNRLSGPIPESVGEAEQLRAFVAYGNGLSGPIPRQMGFTFKLRYLDLSFNALEGPIPPDLGFLPDVETLYLNNNKLSGGIPKSLSLMTSLKQLRLENNALQGKVKPFGPDGVFEDEEHREYLLTTN